MITAALVILALVSGYLAGYGMGRRIRKQNAPAPVDIGYDPQNPMNAGRGWEPVKVEGYTFYRVTP